MKSPFRFVSTLVPLALAACSSDPVAKDPPRSESLTRPSTDQEQDLRQAERRFLERKPDWDAARDRLARDPVTGPQVVRMLIFHAITSFRDEPAYGEDPGLALARLDADTLLARCLAEFRVLGALAVDRVFDDLVAHRSTENRAVGVLILAAIGVPALPRLSREAVHGASPVVRRAAIQGLGVFAGDAAVVAALRQQAGDPDWQIRGSAVEALGAARDASTTALLDGLAGTDPDAFVRRKAIHALGVQATPASAQALLVLLERGVAQRSDHLRDIQQALRRITRKEFGARVDAWREWLAAHPPASRPAADTRKASQ